MALLPESDRTFGHCRVTSCGHAVQVYALEIEEYMQEFSKPYFEKASVADKVCRFLGHLW